MRGLRYIGGNRAGKVEDIDEAFLADVAAAVAEGAPVFVRMSPDLPSWFAARLDEIGCPYVVDDYLVEQAFLIEEVGNG